MTVWYCTVLCSIHQSLLFDLLQQMKVCSEALSPENSFTRLYSVNRYLSASPLSPCSCYAPECLDALEFLQEFCH